MKYARMREKDSEPNQQHILKTIGQTEHWECLLAYLEASYDISPELAFYGKKYGWTLRYRKSGRTLISLFPEEGAFSVQIVLGKKEVEETLAILDELNAYNRDLFKRTKQLHDGRWLWIRVLEATHVDDVKRLMQIKRRPEKGNP